MLHDSNIRTVISKYKIKPITCYRANEHKVKQCLYMVIKM